MVAGGRRSRVTSVAADGGPRSRRKPAPSRRGRPSTDASAQAIDRDRGAARPSPPRSGGSRSASLRERPRAVRAQRRQEPQARLHAQARDLGRGPRRLRPRRAAPHHRGDRGTPRRAAAASWATSTSWDAAIPDLSGRFSAGRVHRRASRSWRTRCAPPGVRRIEGRLVGHEGALHRRAARRGLGAGRTSCGGTAPRSRRSPSTTTWPTCGSCRASARAIPPSWSASPRHVVLLASSPRRSRRPPRVKADLKLERDLGTSLHPPLRDASPLGDAWEGRPRARGPGAVRRHRVRGGPGVARASG